MAKHRHAYKQLRAIFTAQVKVLPVWIVPLFPFAGTQNGYIGVTVFGGGYPSVSVGTKNWRFVIMATSNVTVKRSYSGNEHKCHSTNDSSVRLPKQSLSCQSLCNDAYKIL